MSRLGSQGMFSHSFIEPPQSFAARPTHFAAVNEALPASFPDKGTSSLAYELHRRFELAGVRRRGTMCHAPVLLHPRFARCVRPSRKGTIPAGLARTKTAAIGFGNRRRPCRPADRINALRHAERTPRDATGELHGERRCKFQRPGAD